MPLDPSIIANSMTNITSAMPDVSNLMAQRAQGMENIYKIERQREADAQAAAQAQAEELTAALSPAIAAAFTDPSDEGLSAALGMVPEQYRGAAQAQLDQLRSIGDLNQRKNIMRAALVQDDVGQRLLAQLEPTANMRLQADTAAAAQALKMRELQLREAQVQAAKQAPISTQQPPEEAAAPPMDPKVKLKLDQAYPQAVRNLQSSVTELDKDITDVQALINDKAGLDAITGVYGAYTPNISPEARRAQALYDKIRAGAGFSALQAMRDASPTGGALGNVSNQEGAKLEQSVAAFSQVQDADDLRAVLRQYLIDLQVAQENVRAAFDETYSYRGEAPSSDIATQTRERRKQMEREVTKTPLPPGVTVKRN
jgi:hypothetical protein